MKKLLPVTSTFALTLSATLSLHADPLVETFMDVDPRVPVSPNWVINGNLSLGNDSNGYVTISGGGTVSNVTGYLGTRTNKYGTMTVQDQGSLWTNSADIAVGNDGIGTLRIYNGGKVVNNTGYVAINQFSRGEVEVKGAGSWWQNNADLQLGYQSIAYMDVLEGGKVTSVSGYIGWNSTGTGYAKVDGAGSFWENSSNLNIGGSGAGTLTLTNGGKVVVKNGTGTINLAIFSAGKGTLNIGGGNVASGTAAGVIEAGKIVFGSGTGVINFNQTNTTTLTAAISGGGSVNQQGTGTSILTGTNTYTGATTVSGGTLQLNGNISASTVTVKNGGTIGGNGSFFHVTAEAGSYLAPGNSIGTLSAASLTWNSSANLVFELGDGESDLLSLSGMFSRGSGSGPHAFTFVDSGWQLGETYTLVQFGSTNFSASDFTFNPTGGIEGSFVIEGNALKFQLTAIPEPSAAAIALTAVIGAGTFRRRRACR